MPHRPATVRAHDDHVDGVVRGVPDDLDERVTDPERPHRLDAAQRDPLEVPLGVGLPLLEQIGDDRRRRPDRPVLRRRVGHDVQHVHLGAKAFGHLAGVAQRVAGGVAEVGRQQDSLEGHFASLRPGGTRSRSPAGTPEGWVGRRREGGGSPDPLLRRIVQFGPPRPEARRGDTRMAVSPPRRVTRRHDTTIAESIQPDPEDAAVRPARAARGCRRRPARRAS